MARIQELEDQVADLEKQLRKAERTIARLENAAAAGAREGETPPPALEDILLGEVRALATDSRMSNDAVGAALRAKMKEAAAAKEAAENPSPEPAPAPVLTSIAPNTAVVGGPDLVMVCTGEGFTAETVIKWNDMDEPTTLISPTQVSTGVKPSLSSGPHVSKVKVRNGALESAELDFTMTAAAR